MAQFFRSSQPDFMKKHGHKLSQVKKRHKTLMEEKAGALFKDGVVECPEAVDEEGLNAWKKANKNAAPSCSHVPAPTSLPCSIICVSHLLAVKEAVRGLCETYVCVWMCVDG